MASPGIRAWRPWAGMLAPAAVYLVASALLKRALLFCASGLALPPEQLNIAASAATSVLLAPWALFLERRDRSGIAPGSAFYRNRIPVISALASVGLGVLLGVAAALVLPQSAGGALDGPAWLIALRSVSLCLTGPLCEEAVYRGLVLRRGEALLGAAPAALVSAALFAAGHGAPAQLLPAFIAGIAFAAVSLHARRRYPPRWALILPLLCHAASNAALMGFDTVFRV